MLILLHGQDTYRSREKLREIIAKYKKIHQTGLDLNWLKEEDLVFDKLKQKIEAVSMFDEKKLIILEDVFQNKDFQEEFFKYVQKNKLKENKEVIIVIYEKKSLTSNITHFSMFQEFKPLEGSQLINWIKKEVTKNNGRIEPAAIQKLALAIGNDLWRMNNEINKLISYKNNQMITAQDIEALSQTKIETDIFKTIDALGARNKKTALRLLHQHLEQGQNEIYLLSMLTYQLRNLIKLKELVTKGVPYYQLSRATKLHPFVIKKTWSQLKNFTLEQLKRIYQQLLETEIAIKTGQIEPKTALDLLVTSLIAD